MHVREAAATSSWWVVIALDDGAGVHAITIAESVAQHSRKLHEPSCERPRKVSWRLPSSASETPGGVALGVSRGGAASARQAA